MRPFIVPCTRAGQWRATLGRGLLRNPDGRLDHRPDARSFGSSGILKTFRCDLLFCLLIFISEISKA